MVFEQYREVVTSAGAFSELDMELDVSMEKDGTMKFDALIWNLTESTWRGISEDDIVQIKGGWADGPVEVLIYGKINSKNMEVDGNDIRFNIKGKDQTSSATNARISRTWTDKDPGQIAADMAREIGLSPQSVNVGDVISGNWSATPDQQIKKWLDDLVTIAGEKTGAEWEWTGEQGELIFQPKDGTYREAPVLSWENNLVSIAEKDSAGEGSEQQKVEFEAMMTPGIRKGAAVDVQGVDQFTDVWKVESYSHTSSTQGDHVTSGVLIPTDQEYPIEATRTVNSGVRAIQSLGGGL